MNITHVHFKHHCFSALCKTSMLAVVTLLVLLAFGSGVQRSAAQAGTPAPSGSSNIGCWTTYSSPPIGLENSEITGLTAVASDDVWAVGSFYSASSPSNTQAFTLHWDGRQWNTIALPVQGLFSSNLGAVAAVATDDVWAIGQYRSSASEGGTLVLRWDGKAWTQVPAPGLAAFKARFLSMAAVSKNDIWAVGADYSQISQAGGEKLLIAHWDGQSWQPASTPDIGGNVSILRGVAALSANDVWAVGVGTKASMFQPLVMHWDGAQWSVMSGLDLQEGGQLYGVTVARSTSGAASSVWAVGMRGGSSTSPSATLVMHWDSTRWSVVNSPSAEGSYNVNTLYAVAATTADKVWAAGEGSPEQPLIASVEGQQGRDVSDVSAALAASPVRVLRLVVTAAAQKGDVWFAGVARSTTGNGSNTVGVLVRHTDAPCASATPSPSQSPSTPLSVPGTGSHLFPETGKTVNGIFLDYWTKNGRLAQFGFPLSGLTQEVSDLDGKPYIMQYFERAVFEYHPEKQPPYNVLLSQLGTLRYKQKYPSGASAPNQQQPQQGGKFFAETSKTVSGKFLDYWTRNGGIARQGYPISEPFMEKSDLDGKVYLVQYFERAVFEMHTENQSPYDVLLSQLGTFRYKQQNGEGNTRP